MPCDYSNYPKNWLQIRQAILERAGHKCEFCGLANGAIGYRDASGDFHSLEKAEMSDWPLDDETKMFKIVLTIAHLNHNTMDNRPENLRALCQKCHLNYDKGRHSETRRATIARKQGLIPLF